MAGSSHQIERPLYGIVAPSQENIAHLQGFVATAQGLVATHARRCSPFDHITVISLNAFCIFNPCQVIILIQDCASTVDSFRRDKVDSEIIPS